MPDFARDRAIDSPMPPLPAPVTMAVLPLVDSSGRVGLMKEYDLVLYLAVVLLKTAARSASEKFSADILEIEAWKRLV